MVKNLIGWEDTREFQEIARTIGKNRKLLLEQFAHYKLKGDDIDLAKRPTNGGATGAKASDSLVIFESAKHVLGMVLRGCRLSD